jgi:uncharacterized protein (TIGR02996 family)
MNQEDAFIEAILQNPDDNAARLVYADWLEERGDLRSEIIRARCRIADLPDGDRANLETILQQSWAQHWNEWVEHCGLVLKWDQALAAFERRLAETVAWCDGRQPDSMRSPALHPPSLLGRFIESEGRQVWNRPTTEERQRIVNALANRRVRLLSERREKARNRPWRLSPGRLVLFYPDGTLSDAAAEPESHGYFDADNVPAWDTWVFFAEDGASQEGVHNMYLVACLPPHLVDAVDSGLRVNPEECIRWAADVDTTLTRKLREAGLLV